VTNQCFFLSFIIAGLERVAEELMGRRKWKLYQDILTGKNINTETTTTTATESIEEKLTTSRGM
jgi:hypothetical protein